MKIEHVAMYVKNLEQSALFFETYFGGNRNALYHNPKTGFSSYFIRFSDGSRLELMNDKLKIEKPEKLQLGYSHIAFSVGSENSVIALTKRLKSDGYCVVSEPRTTGDGYFESCICDNEGNRIEITV